MDLEDALRELLPDQEHARVEQGELVAAAVEAWRRRHVNTEAGSAVIAALASRGLSYRQIAELTGIPAATAHRWARPPEQDAE
jgi:DNA-directed RNA polymerase specialized sigma24 family protein